MLLLLTCNCDDLSGKRFNLVKLYDLTTLCGNSDPNKGVTPFSIPVAMLLYRVARKLRLKNNYSRHIPEIKALLQTSLQLLDETEHAEVRALLCVSHRACRGESTPLCVS